MADTTYKIERWRPSTGFSKIAVSIPTLAEAASVAAQLKSEAEGRGERNVEFIASPEDN